MHLHLSPTQGQRGRTALVALVLSILIALSLALGTPGRSAHAQGQTGDQVCYAVADNGGSSDADDLILVNRSSGTTTYVKPLKYADGATVTDVEAIAMQPGTQQLFAHARRNGTSGSSQLGTINVTTGVFSPFAAMTGTLKGSSGDFAASSITDVDGLTFKPGDQNFLYASWRRGGPDILFKVNPATGQFVPNAFGTNKDYLVVAAYQTLADIDDIALSADGTLYGIANNGGGSSPSALVTINQSNGNTTGVTITLNGSNLTDVEGLSFTYDGRLQATTGADSNPSSNDDHLYDIATNGVATLPINLATPRPTGGTARDFEGSDCLVNPLAVTLESFTATYHDSSIMLEWATVSEMDNLGFNLYRGTSADGELVKINGELIPSVAGGGSMGGSYSYTDSDIEVGTTYYYYLESIDTMGTPTRYGPAVAVPGAPTAITISALSGHGERNTLALLLGAVGIALGAGVWLRRR